MSMMTQKPIDDEVMNFAIAGTKPMLESLEVLLKNAGTHFLIGDSVSLADLQLFYEATDEGMFGRTFEAYPNITAWMARMLEIKEVKQVMDQFN